MHFESNGKEPTLLQLKYRDEEGKLGSLRAEDLAEALRGLSGLVHDFATAGALGDGPPPEVRVEPTKEGSFIVDAFLSWGLDWETTANIVTTVSPPTAGLTWLVSATTKSMRAKPADVEYLDGGRVKLTWTDGETEVVPAAAWEELNRGAHRKRRKKQLRQIMAPLSHEADLLELRSGTESEVATEDPEFVATRADYRVVALDTPEVEDSCEVFEAEVQVEAVDFTSDGKWRIRFEGGSRQAFMEDEGFRKRIDNGLAIGKEDTFRMRIRVEGVMKSQRRRNVYTIEKVLSHTPRSDDDDTRSAPPTPEA